MKINLDPTVLIHMSRVLGYPLPDYVEMTLFSMYPKVGDAPKSHLYCKTEKDETIREAGPAIVVLGVRQEILPKKAVTLSWPNFHTCLNRLIEA